jgi:uncharacterized damage-inducible protein DinB
MGDHDGVAHAALIPEVVSEMMKVSAVEARSDSPSPATQFAITDAFERGATTLGQTLATLAPQELSATVTFTAGGRALFGMTRQAILRTILLNHSYHHRGQLSVYLRLLDVPVPMVYGPTADENPFGQ